MKYGYVYQLPINLIRNGANRNSNNLVRFHFAALAQNYLNEFEEMFIYDSFGAGSPSNTSQRD